MEHITSINTAGLSLIKSFESFVNHPYADPGSGGKPFTIGYGTTIYPNGIRVTMTDPNISEEIASQYLLANIKHYEEGVDSLTIDSLSSNQFSACVSFCYNLGIANFKASTLLKMINKNPGDSAIKAEWLKWDYSAGHKMAGLTRRRNAEFLLYAS